MKTSGSKGIVGTKRKHTHLKVSEAYRTQWGRMLVGRIEDALHRSALKSVSGKDLVPRCLC
jgi:hypothetical protein